MATQTQLLSLLLLHLCISCCDSFLNQLREPIRIHTTFSQKATATDTNIDSAPSSVPGKRNQQSSQKPAKKQSLESSTKQQIHTTERENQSSSLPTQEQRDAWRAPYHISRKTQWKIQQAGGDRQGKGSSKRTSTQRATDVLETLLKTPPERCNAANVVCALTLSAKVLQASPTRNRKNNDRFRQKLMQVLDILHHLVAQECLHERQLCNAVWAIAKHADRDPILLLSSLRTAVHATSGPSVVETWDLNNDNLQEQTETSCQRLMETLNAIAQQLTGTLTREQEQLDEFADKILDHEENTNDNNKQKKQKKRLKRHKETKLNELCMASWAYGILRPRQKPPGWLAPPQIGKLSPIPKKQARENEGFMSSNNSKRRENDVITFEQWTMNDEELAYDVGSSHLEKKDTKPLTDPVDRLFDAIAEALCRPLHNGDIDIYYENKSIYEPPFELMRLTTCSWSEMANLAWAFEKRGHCLTPASEMLLRSLTREASLRLQNAGRETRHMLSRDISQLFWALGALQQDNFRLAHDLVDLVESFTNYKRLATSAKKSELEAIKQCRENRPFVEWSCPDLVQIILCLAHARIDESQLLQALFDEALIRLEDGIITDNDVRTGRKSFVAWEACVLLWAQARLCLTVSEGRVFEEFPSRVAACLLSALDQDGSLQDVGVGSQEQANIAWALTVLQQHKSEESIGLLQAVFREAATACRVDGLIQLEHAHQLWQSLFLLEEESPLSVEHVPRWFREYLSEKWNHEKSRKKISSARHKSISQVLNLMGIVHYNEHDEDIDVAIVLKRKATWTHETERNTATEDSMGIAVEFDGPNHFTRKTGMNPVRALGHTVLKYRLLKRKGWTVVRVPYYEFDKIPFWASMERQRYLQRLLKTHGNIRFSDVDVSEYQALTPNRRTRFD